MNEKLSDARAPASGAHRRYFVQVIYRQRRLNDYVQERSRIVHECGHGSLAAESYAAHAKTAELLFKYATQLPACAQVHF